MHVTRHLCSTVSTDMLVWLNLTTFSYISLKGILSTGICLFDIIMCNNLNVLFLQTVLFFHFDFTAAVSACFCARLSCLHGQLLLLILMFFRQI